MTASLPMYDRPETRAAQQALWEEIRRSAPDGRDLPTALSLPTDLHGHWRRKDLVFSQTCSLPLQQGLHAHVRILGTPDYGLPDCPPGFYNSVIVMRQSDTRPAQTPFLRAVVNGFDSQSGWGALCTFLGQSPERVAVSGAHLWSARAVANGKADLAAIDAQSWRMMRRWDRWSDGLREVARTSPTPGLCFVAAKEQPDRFDIAQALSRFRDAAQLDICGFVAIPMSSYLDLPPCPAPKTANDACQ